MNDPDILSAFAFALLQLCAVDGPQPTKGQTKAARVLCDRGLAVYANKSQTKIAITKAGGWCVERCQ